jgi:tripartite-type tricarboxylate transporter receptor subunit TctC
MQCTRRDVLRQTASGLLAGLFPALSGAKAQGAFPTQPIRFVVPFSAGGTADVLARAIGMQLQTRYGYAAVVENRTGAAGNVGAMAVAKAPADGHTLVLGTVGIHAAYAIYKNLGYDPSKDLRPIVVLGEVPCVLVVHPSLPFRTLDQFLAYVKANPDRLTFGSAGVGSSTHLVGELFQQAAGVRLRHVPYRGSSMAMNDLLGGQIDAMFEQITTAAPIIAAGNIRALGVTSLQRSAALLDVPTVSELAISGFYGTGWFTVATGAAVPEAVVNKLNRDINEILNASNLQEMWTKLALTVIGGSAADAEKYFEAERQKWRKVIEAANIHID